VWEIIAQATDDRRGIDGTSGGADDQLAFRAKRLAAASFIPTDAGGSGTFDKAA
jgi:hypothetical protein